jgi:hypothetical protein
METHPRPLPDVPLFLWRGARQVGSLQLRDDLLAPAASEARHRGELHAILLADGPDRSDVLANELASLWQRPRPFVPSDVLMQRRQSAYDMASRSDATHIDGVVSRGRWQNVNAPDAIYSIRAADAEAQPFRVISLLEVRLAPGHEAEILKRLPPSALIGGRLWAVTAFP